MRAGIASDCKTAVPRLWVAWRFAALSFLQDLDHGGGSNNSGGFVMLQGEEFLVAGHEEVGLAGFSQREQKTVLGVRRDGAGSQVPAKKRSPEGSRRAVRPRWPEVSPGRTVGRRHPGVPL